MRRWEAADRFITGTTLGEPGRMRGPFGDNAGALKSADDDPEVVTLADRVSVRAGWRADCHRPAVFCSRRGGVLQTATPACSPATSECVILGRRQKQSHQLGQAGLHCCRVGKEVP